MGEERILKSLHQWEGEIKQYNTNDFERMYELWTQSMFHKIPDHYQQKFFELTDQWFLYTYAFLQGTSYQINAQERILQTARTFHDDIQNISDLKKLRVEQLTYLADQQLAKSRVYSFTQGGITGTGGWFLLGVDFPLMVTLNLRSVQLIGSSFGYDMNNPIEMVLALKVLHGGILPRRLKYEAWEELKRESSELETIMKYEALLTDHTWFEQPINQVFKTLAIVMFRKKLFQGIPLISVGIGAFSNYKLAKDVTDFAKHFYQYRHLNEHK
ncbi:EcsC family protein [Aquisalibacillus elongatus]|uniref:EcsC family protein n=1 Tax=Aquisalibacillus elongatus TaxID=485577 RepID=A0A3N5CDW9_9BACI|nr:EcsC family protein [Aquisalibacillus elongatus]RPF55351.1 EcsC family protein [Aquisalibacillus elongatus]